MHTLLLAALIAFSPLAGASTPAEDLKTLVEMNSGTSNVDGVNEVQDWIADKLKTLGFEVELKPNTVAKTGKLLIATLKGKSPKVVTLVLHADTVFEPSSAFQKFSLSEDGIKAFGPGVIDDKGGIVVALRGLEAYLKENPTPAYTLKVVSSPCEETSVDGTLEDFKKLSAVSSMVLGFEPALDDGSIVESRRGNRWYHIRVKGKEAHAGRAHADGINACVELATKLAEISKLTDYKNDVTVSVGRVQGGQDKFNIVCGEAEAKVDARFTRIDRRDKLHKKIDAILKKPIVRSYKTGETTQTTYEIANDSPPLATTPASKRAIGDYLKAIESIESKSVVSKPSGGSADASYFAREGLVVFDGLGPVGGKMHTGEEFILLSSLDSRAKALVLFLKNLKL